MGWGTGHLGGPATHFRGENPRFPWLGSLPGRRQTLHSELVWGACPLIHPSVGSEGPGTWEAIHQGAGVPHCSIRKESQAQLRPSVQPQVHGGVREGSSEEGLSEGDSCTHQRPGESVSWVGEGQQVD